MIYWANDIEDEWWNSLTEDQQANFKEGKTEDELIIFLNRRKRFEDIPENELTGDEWFLNQ